MFLIGAIKPIVEKKLKICFIFIGASLEVANQLYLDPKTGVLGSR
jgi:hypothetical protein